MKVDIYTDGGCSGNPGPGAWAYVVLEKMDIQQSNLGDEPGTILKKQWGAEANTTNNRMELTAAVAALSAVEQDLCRKPEKVRIFTDSQYLQRGISQWIGKWKKNGWRTAGKEPVKNRDLWEKLDALNIAMAVEWYWVKGHAGNVYNELCDTMTQEGIRSVSRQDLHCLTGSNGV
jgi:ribonuclease HI